MRIAIVVPYEGAERYTGVWAYEESKVDFRRQEQEANRCTTSFAAMELSACLERFVTDVQVSFCSEAGAVSWDHVVELVIEQGQDADAYCLEPIDSGVRIAGGSRRALLYGVYEFLKLSGWRWYYPGAGGERAPHWCESPVWPNKKLAYAPKMPYGRGFDLAESYAHISPDFLMWMVRNRLSVATSREPTAALCKKLGFISKFGGHIFEDMLRPDRPWSDGGTLYDAHPEWYGLPQDGIRTKEQAMKVQLCVAHQDMFDYIGAELVRMLQNEWKDHDRIDIWGFDTWGSECGCDACHELGNNTDRSVIFLSMLRQRIDDAFEQGVLDHQVQLIMCSYEGTVTLQAPTRPTPRRLLSAGDGVVFYPINRCYAHQMTDPGCSINAYYRQTVEDWANSPNQLPVVIGEYYNVSKFEDLPLLFRRTMWTDMAFYSESGFLGTTYMHVPMMLWGVRAMTNYSFAQLSWDPYTDQKALENDYFFTLYGSYAATVRNLYDIVEEALSEVTLWRAWDSNSLLSQLLQWDGSKPDRRLFVNGHLSQGIEAVGEKCCAALKKAQGIAQELVCQERERFVQTAPVISSAAVNPEELRRLNMGSPLQLHLEELMRQSGYAHDLMEGMTAACAYHDALSVGEEVLAERCWARLEEAESRLQAYYAPITGYKRGGIYVEDALTRAQLRSVLLRCRIARRQR